MVAIFIAISLGISAAILLSPQSSRQMIIVSNVLNTLAGIGAIMLGAMIGIAIDRRP